MQRSRSLDFIAIAELKGVGAAVATRLGNLGIETVQDMLFHLPFRYQDRTRLTPIGALRPGKEAVVSGEVLLAEIIDRRRRALLVRLHDGTGSITLRFFHFSAAQARQFKQGSRLQCFGEVRRGPAMLEMVHPEYRFASQGQALQNTLTPFYHSTEGIQQAGLRRLTDQALAFLESGSLADWLPHEWLAPLGLPPLAEALRIAHRPPPDADIAALLDGLHPAHRRLALEELIAHRLALRQLRARARRHRAPVVQRTGSLADRLERSLPFALTAAQRRVLADISRDMQVSEPMLRLVQGDVGSGKTIVAALAAAEVVAAGYQVALMAPTEILAEQHLLTLSGWFEPIGVETGWLTGKLKASARRAAIEAIAMGRTQIVVGTHALFQSDVEFERLGLAIIDEQHRFGVHQRMALRDKGADNAQVATVLPHQLIMTATPIPRTLAMTAYADLDCSIIDELPPGRQAVRTVALDSSRRDELIARVAAALADGRQIYWVCTLIEDSESLQAEAAEATFALLEAALPAHRIALVHGRMKPRDKEAVMQAFAGREIDLLVATTVIEVGVDVPNASLMIIENAERLGLSQLHQLRGRVGRGQTQSSCILLYQAPLSPAARQRLAILRQSNDGFLIAEKDLELRGAGEVLGTRQTGLAEFRIADLSRDDDMLDVVSTLADRLMTEHPERAASLVRRWIGARDAYGSV